MFDDLDGLLLQVFDLLAAPLSEMDDILRGVREEHAYMDLLKDLSRQELLHE